MVHRWNPNARRSRVGQKLSDLTSQRVIVLILTMLLIIPGFNWNCGLYGGYNNISDGGLKMLHDIYLADGNTTGFQQVSSQKCTNQCLVESQTGIVASVGSCTVNLASNSGWCIGGVMQYVDSKLLRCVTDLDVHGRLWRTTTKAWCSRW